MASDNNNTYGIFEKLFNIDIGKQALGGKKMKKIPTQVGGKIQNAMRVHFLFMDTLNYVLCFESFIQGEQKYNTCNQFGLLLFLSIIGWFLFSTIIGFALLHLLLTDTLSACLLLFHALPYGSEIVYVFCFFKLHFVKSTELQQESTQCVDINDD